MRITTLITTCNRREQAEALVEDLDYRLGSDLSGIVVMDDGSRDRPLFDPRCKLEVYRRRHPGGVARFWGLCNNGMRLARHISSTHILWLPDDVTLVPNFRERLHQAWEDCQRCSCRNPTPLGAINLLGDERRGRVSWVQRRVHSFQTEGRTYYHSHWIDMAFLADRLFFDQIRWRIPGTYEPGRRKSSGVGRWLSISLDQRGWQVFQVHNTLLHHDGHAPSMMHPDTKRPHA